MNKGVIAIGIMCLLLGYIIGFSAGSAWALNWGVDLAIHFASRKKSKLKTEDYNNYKMKYFQKSKKK